MILTEGERGGRKLENIKRMTNDITYRPPPPPTLQNVLKVLRSDMEMGVVLRDTLVYVWSVFAWAVDHHTLCWVRDSCTGLGIRVTG